MTVASAIAVDYSEEDLETGTDYNGDADWDRGYDSLGFLDKLRVSQSQPFTIIGGAQCSSYPTWSNEEDDTYKTTSQLCWRNDDGGSPQGQGDKHLGVAYQVFEIVEGTGGWKFLGEVQIEAGEVGCLQIVPNKHYHRDAYYCDDISIKCTNFYSVCNENQGVLRERLCTNQATGETYPEQTLTSWLDNRVGSCSEKVEPTDSTEPTDPVLPPPATTPSTYSPPSMFDSGDSQSVGGMLVSGVAGTGFPLWLVLIILLGGIYWVLNKKF